MRHKTLSICIAVFVALVFSSQLPNIAKADDTTQGLGLAASSVTQADEATTRTVNLAVLSDVHYVNPADIPTSETGLAAFEYAEKAEVRLMSEIDTILVKALHDAAATNPDAVLVSGDLTSNGEYANAQQFAQRLREAKGSLSDDTGIYVVNGNHDMNMSYAAKFEDTGATAAKRMQQADFRELFDGLGYNGGEGFSYYADESDDAAADGTVRNSGGLSYCTKIADGITLIALDTAMYANNDKALFNDAQQTPGSVSPGLLQWAAQKAKEAKAEGDLVIAMAHHAMLPHYTEKNSTIDSFMKQVVITNWQEVADTLADAGVTAYFTGHSHSNDIASYVSPNGNTIYDINTAGLCAYPCAWRTVKITITGEGDDATYSFDIDSNFIDSIDGIDDLQSHAYAKTGLTEANLEPLIDYLVRLQMHDVKNFNDEAYGTGLQGWISKTFDLDPTSESTLGEQAGVKIKELLMDLDVTQEFSILGLKKVLTAKFNSIDEAEEVVTIDLGMASDGDGDPDTGKLYIDLTAIPLAIDTLMQTIEENDLAEVGADKDGTYGIYATTDLQKDINKLACTVIKKAGTQPLDANDPNSSALNILNEAYQAYLRGDEETFVWKGLGIDSAEQLATSREHWRELLMSDELAEQIRSTAFDEIKKLNTSDYPRLRTLIKDTSLVPSSYDDPEANTWFIKYDGDSLGLLTVAGTILSAVKNGSDLLNIAGLLSDGANPLSVEFAKERLETPMANMQLSFTNDSNIPSDAKWSFHNVVFDANGGTVSQASDLTVEDGKLGRCAQGMSLPEPTREGYFFGGWYTAAEDGVAVDENTDFTGIERIYAHWLREVTDADVAISVGKITFDGKDKTPNVNVTVDGKKLVQGTDYTVAYSDNKNAGTAQVTITGIGGFHGTKVATFNIAKAKQTLKVKAKTKKLKAKNLKKKKKLKKLIKVSNAHGKVTYKNVSKAKKAKKFKVKAKTGVIVVPKNCKKGTYKLTVKVTAKGDNNYEQASKTVKVKIKVK